MQQQAQVTLGGVLAAHNRHDAGGFAALFAHEGVVRTVPTGDAAQGREDVAAFLAAHFQSFPDSQIERRGVYACAACTWVEWTITGTHAGEFMGHPASHRGFELHGCSRFTFTGDGLIAEDALYFDPATILRQLGLTRDDLRVA
ncbi:MAG: hypothetical protein QOI19_1511 [Thermoleophilaceae bacterium]|nr:hypothetical protein [Thermoleophilaceae bacterium]